MEPQLRGTGKKPESELLWSPQVYPPPPLTSYVYFALQKMVHTVQYMCSLKKQGEEYCRCLGTLDLAPDVWFRFQHTESHHGAILVDLKEQCHESSPLIFL